MINRRSVLLGSAALGALAAMPRRAMAQGSGTGADAKLNAMFDTWVQEDFRLNPESATYAGMDKDDMAWAKAALGDNTIANAQYGLVLNRRREAQLKQVQRTTLGASDATSYDVVQYTLETQIEGQSKFPYIGAPYTISQLSGAYQSIPDFLDNQHSIETKADADAYLSRMAAFARVMREELGVMQHDVALGIVPPDFVLDKTLIQMNAMLGVAAKDSPLIESLTRRTKEKGIAGNWAEEAERIYAQQIVPALQAQADYVKSLRPSAVHDAGVWRLPQGADFYRWSLGRYTTSSITPEEVHQTGLNLVASHHAEIDALMQKVGMTSGTVGERLRAMYQDPKYRYPNDDAGKEKLLADLNAQVQVIKAKLPQWFGALPKADLQIKRVPKAIEAGAPGGYYNSPPLDNSRPGIYWINLRDTAEVPSWTLPTLTYHEGLPGHHLQNAVANEAGDLPLIRKLAWFSGYGEGWALYSEQLAVEMGMFADDPLGHIGQLHDSLFRAVRMVVDSGMHFKKWSREQAVKYMVDTMGDQESSAITEIERYCVWPGQACSYMVGKLTWLKLRDEAKAALGDKFDIRAFHDAGLLAGAMPLNVLEERIRAYIAEAKG